MVHQRRIFLMAIITIGLILGTMILGVGILWERVLQFHVIQLSTQIRATLIREVSEGNYFGVSATLDRLRMAGLYSRIALIDTGNDQTQWLYASDDSFHENLGQEDLLSRCFSGTSKRNLQIGNELLYSVPLKASSDLGHGVCALVATELSEELLQLRRLVLFIFVIIAIFAISGFTYLIIRLNRQQLKFQNIAAQKFLEKAEALGQLASQVSHDIRSPLTALNMLVGSINSLPEEQRLILRGATQRINDIANQLLATSRPRSAPLAKSDKPEKSSNSRITPILVPAVIDLLISEKRVQFRGRTGIRIEYDSGQLYNAFVKFPADELGRILSNLINNSVEALQDERGKVSLALRAYGSQIQVLVMDTGKGIPEYALDKIGTKGFSVGKTGTESGSGLGLYHAKTVLENYKGRLEVVSREGRGTIITLTIPRTEAPVWFVGNVKVHAGSTIVIVDDDDVIHEVWKRRFSNLDKDVTVISFSSTKDFQNWLHREHHNHQDFLVLMDYEFLGHTESGIQVIERLRIENRSILVTSRYDEAAVQEQAQLRGLLIIPKSMAPLVPVSVV